MLKNVFLATLVAVQIAASAQAEKSRTMVVSANPISAAMGAFSGTFQCKLTDYLALTVPVSVGTNFMVLGWGETFSALSGEKYDSKLLFGNLGLGARFLLNNNGLNDGFFIEPGIKIGHSRYNIKKETTNLIDANRWTMFGTVGFGYSWFWESGFYMSPHIEVGAGYHLNSKSVKVDEGLKSRLKDHRFQKYAMWAEDSAWRPMFGGGLDIGYSW